MGFPYPIDSKNAFYIKLFCTVNFHRTPSIGKPPRLREVPSPDKNSISLFYLKPSMAQHNYEELKTITAYMAELSSR